PGSVGAGYPAPPAPTGLFATTDFPNWIDLGWSLPLDANVDGFFIYRQNAAPLIRDTFEVVNPGRRTYRDVFFTLTGLPINGIAYEIAAYRQVGGQLFVSSPNPAANGRVSNPGPASQLTAVEASKGTFANRT
ncbi:fibronectin type III domain-containing protein, partial [Arthrospira platensis SPKY1]|nr:fibronectin type III domain-containing protein [Arthrospira platensis SPKY1]